YRYPDFAGQLEREPRAHREVRAAILRFVTGFVRLGALGLLAQHASTQRLFNDPGSLSAWRFLASLYATPLGIYLWISAYVDFAVGMGRLMGFTVPENFNYPWISTSIANFWRRWHMTMGAWLRDYIYIPLGGNRRHVFFNYFI